MMRILFI